MTLPAEGGALAKFFAKKVVEGFPGNKNTKTAAVNEIDLANRISEVMIETQVAGASFLKAHIIDPELALTVSGWLEVKEGLLEPIEVEFPSDSGWHWMLCAVEGSTSVQDANLIVTFEDRIVYFLRQYYGVTHTPSGVQTRAQFIRKLVAEVGRHGEPKAGFVCPSLNTPQPLATENEGNKVKTLEAETEAKESLSKASGPITQTSWAESLLTAMGLPKTKTNIEAIIGWETAEGGAGPQFKVPNNTANYNPLNTTQEESGATNTGVQGNIKSYTSWQQGLQATVTTLNNGHYTGILNALKAGNSKDAVAQAIGESPWGTSGALVQETIKNAKTSSGGITVGAGSEEEATSDVGQLQRGTSSNPDEDSFECAVRLATQVSWFFFSDNRNFFYMNGKDLMKQKPALYVDVVNNRIRFPDGTKREGVIHAPTTYHFDNTTFEYRISHKLKTRVQRKSKAIKPATPAEVKLLIECDINQFHAGEAMRIVNSGPMNGQWIITNTRRECLKDIYTEIILEPPVEPLPEPRSTGEEEEPEGNNPIGNAPSKTALAAFNASSKLSEMQLPYLWGGGHGSNALSQVKKGGAGLDCSGSTCWVLHQAGMFPSTSAQVSGELENFGESGEGKEMTIWAGPNHVYIEFHIGGHDPAQMNTNGPQNGPRLYTLSQTPTYNGEHGAGSGGPFVARHFKGT